jgi:hypothetical protein
MQQVLVHPPTKGTCGEENNCLAIGNSLTSKNNNEISSRSSVLKAVDTSDPGVTALEITESRRGMSLGPPCVLMNCMNP